MPTLTQTVLLAARAMLAVLAAVADGWLAVPSRFALALLHALALVISSTRAKPSLVNSLRLGLR